MRILRVEIVTEECDDGEAYTHDLPEKTEPILIFDAIETLYGPETVTGINMYLVDIDDGGPLKGD